MKLKITDLMSLYEDDRRPLTPAEEPERRDPTEQEATQVKQSKHAFGWQQGLSLAAALGIVVLGGFGLRRLLARGPAAQPGQESGAAQTERVTAQTESVQKLTEPEALSDQEQERLNRFLTVFAEQSIAELGTDLDEDRELVRFAFVYRRIHDPETISYLPEGEQLTDTLTPEQVNETLTQLLGRQVEPREGARYDLPGTEEEGGYCSFHDCRFWDSPAHWDYLPRFALAENWDPAAGMVNFRVYALELYHWPGADLEPLHALSVPEAEALSKEGKLRLLSQGQARLEETETGLRLLEYSTSPVE